MESRFLPLAFLLTRSNPSRALKAAQEQEDRQRRRNRRDRAQCAAETAEQRGDRLKKGRERDDSCQAHYSVCERQATLQWKSTSKCGTETPEERETRSGSLPIRALEAMNGCDGIALSLHRFHISLQL